MKVIIPATYYPGRLLGKYKHFEEAPEAMKGRITTVAVLAWNNQGKSIGDCITSLSLVKEQVCDKYTNHSSQPDH